MSSADTDLEREISRLTMTSPSRQTAAFGHSKVSPFTRQLLYHCGIACILLEAFLGQIRGSVKALYLE